MSDKNLNIITGKIDKFFSRLKKKRSILVFILFFPSLLYFSTFLFLQGADFLNRRDEVNVYMIYHLIDLGFPVQQIFTGGIEKGFFLLGYIVKLVSGEHFIVATRIFSIAVGIGVILLAGNICEVLTQKRWAFYLAIGLMLCSQDFLLESTYFRANTYSLLLALLVIRLLLSRIIHEKYFLIFTIGIVYGFSLEIKLLSLVTFIPIVFLVVKNQREKWFARIIVFFVGILISIVSFELLKIGNESPLDMQMSLFFTTSIRVRIQLFFDRILLFSSRHLIIVYFWLISTLGYIFNKRSSCLSSPNLIFLMVWNVSTLGLLFLNYPTWPHHYVFLLPPLITITVYQFLHLIEEGHFRSRVPAWVVFLFLITISSLTSALLFFQLLGNNDHELNTGELVVQVLQKKIDSKSLLWSDNHQITLMGDYYISPELSEMSLKRITSGSLTEENIIELFVRDSPKAVVFADELFDLYPIFSYCINQLSAKEKVDDVVIFWPSYADGAESIFGCFD